MKILIDTNILISSALFPNSVPSQAYMKAVSPPYSAVVSDYSLDEMRRVFNRKFSDKLQVFDTFLSMIFLSVTVISTPIDSESVDKEQAIRDLKDRPILRAAIVEKVDLILTGDKDFLESGITVPNMITAKEFLENY